MNTSFFINITVSRIDESNNRLFSVETVTDSRKSLWLRKVIGMVVGSRKLI